MTPSWTKGFHHLRGAPVHAGRLLPAVVVVVASAAIAAAGCDGRPLAGSGGDGGAVDQAGPSNRPAPQGDGPAERDGGSDASDAASDGDGGSAPDGAGADRPAPVDPEVSRAWTWQACGTIAAEGPDVDAVFDLQGNVAVLGEHGVRSYDSSGAPRAEGTGTAADFLVAAPDGEPLTGTIGSSGIVLTPLGSSVARFTFAPPPPVANCGKTFAFSVKGDYFFTSTSGTICVWRVSTQAFVGNADTSGGSSSVTVRGDGVVMLEDGPTTDVVTRDFNGRETARTKLERMGPAFLSPSGDRLVMGGALWDLDRVERVPWSADPAFSYDPVFSRAGDLVLLADGLFRTADGARIAPIDNLSRLNGARGWPLVLSPDGRRAVGFQFGRAALMDVSSLGIAAVLGPIVPKMQRPEERINQLALSADGSLLVGNITSWAAFGIKVAPRFEESRVAWTATVEVNLEVDISRDGQTVSMAGDGRALYSAADGRIVAQAPPPPPEVSPVTCLPERLRFSPQGTWLAGNNYVQQIEVFPFMSYASGGMPAPLVRLDAGCDAVAFSRDERMMATSGGALYRTASTAAGWQKLWSADVPSLAPSSGVYAAWDDVSFSPDEAQLLVSRCLISEASCAVSLVSVSGGTVRTLPALQGPHPSFSPEGSWIVSGGTLLHLPSGDVRPLDSGRTTTASLFTPDGDIIAASADASFTRYCRNP